MTSEGLKLGTVAIQGERGSNSHMAAVQMVPGAEVVPCNVSVDVFAAILSGRVDCAVLPIENSLHGSVAEHYDLLLQHPVRIDRESLLRITHNLIAAPNVATEDIKRVISHPVALSQCRRFLGALTAVQVTSFYDTAGSVKHVMENNLRDTAGIAPELAAAEYGANVLMSGIEDHAENYTRFYLLRRSDAEPLPGEKPNKLTVAFSIDHRPGTLVVALQFLAEAGVDLTRIESRPVPGKPWEYVFYVDFRFDRLEKAEAALHALRSACGTIKELGRYRGA